MTIAIQKTYAFKEGQEVNELPNLPDSVNEILCKYCTKQDDWSFDGGQYLFKADISIAISVCIVEGEE